MRLQMGVFKTIIVVGWLFVLNNLLAANAMYVKYISKAQYRGYSKNWCITHNEKGFIYVGNDAGLLRFNGIDWHLYQLPQNKNIRSIKIGADEKIYTGSYEEFGFWEQDPFGQITYVSLSEQLSGFHFNSEEIWKIVEDANGNILFQSFSYIFKYNGNSVEPIKLDESILFLLQANGKMIAQTFNRGLVEYIDGKEVPIPGGDFFKGFDIKVFLHLEDDKYLLGDRDKGMYLWDENGFSKWDCPIQNLLENVEIDNGLFDGKQYYIGTHRDGIFVISKDGQLVSHLNTDNHLKSNTVLSMDVDGNGRLWVGQNKGLCYIDFNYPFTFVIREDNPIGIVHTAAFRNDHLYLGTNQGVFYSKVKGDNFEALSLEDFRLVEGTNGQTWELKEIDNQLLCGHSNGTFRLEGGKASLISGYNGTMVFQKLKTENEDLVIQSTFNILVLLDKDQKGHWKFKSKIPIFNNAVSSIEEDFYQNIWLCHFQKKGFFKMKMDNATNSPMYIKAYGTNKGLPTDFGNGVYNIDNKIVFATDSGFYAYEHLRDTIFSYKSLNSQLENFARSKKVVAGDQDTYWFIKPPAIALFKKQEEAFIRQVQYTFDGGVSMVERFENIVPLTSAVSLICLENGFAIYRKDSVGQEIQKSWGKVFVDQVEMENDEQIITPLPITPSHEVVTLPYPVNRLKFKFSNSQTPGEKTVFHSKLSTQRGWMTDYLNSREFYLLPAGSYELEVFAEDKFGRNSEITTYRFEVTPPWYATRWATVLFILLALVIAAVLSKLIQLFLKGHKRTLKLQQIKAMRDKHRKELMLLEKNIMTLKNENLEKELIHKSSDLANSTMAIIRKNEAFQKLKEEILITDNSIRSAEVHRHVKRIIKLIDSHINVDDDWQVFEIHFDRAHVDFFKRLKAEFSTLTPKDLRLCAYLKMNLSSKEIAPLLNISTRSVEVHRYRIRKKIGLNPDQSLAEFMINF